MAEAEHEGRRAFLHSVAATADWLFTTAGARDEAAAFPHDALRVLDAAGLTMAPFPRSLGGAGLTEPADHQVLCRVLRLLGGADLSVGRLYEGHVNAVALVQRYGTASQLGDLARDIRAGALSGVWNAEGTEPARLVHGPGGWQLAGRKILCSGAGALTRPLVPVRRGDAVLMTLPRLAPGERADVSRWTPQGMRATATGTMDLDGLPIGPEAIVGADDDYRRQPGFFGGGWRFCAVQLGAIERLVDLFRQELVARGRDGDPVQRERVARAVIAAGSAAMWVERSAELVASEAREATEILACVGLTRTVVTRAASAVIECVEEGLGLGALMRPHPVERIARDLATYLRQPAPDGARLDAAATVLASTRPTPDLWTVA